MLNRDAVFDITKRQTKPTQIIAKNQINNN
ncbi:hypothetical protein THIAE_06940 [Thiomicrospira aerophila AL3]|uniref:Uncharacterized protein n=1 Tax=Thiomicrospira aerophila AL3 TaxID=717772 RepID=W0DV51_9GAMM|nr:hypothetical protein THIAE_06940 [Thiomicrospira aerophila AL3]